MQNVEEFTKSYRNIFDKEIQEILKERAAGIYGDFNNIEASNKVLYERLSAPIRARDREIVDRCRKALIECDEIGVDKYLFALDSVLRDLG